MKKNLALKTETVRQLSGDELSDVNGGFRRRHHRKPVSSPQNPGGVSSPNPGQFFPTDSIHHPRPLK